MFTSKKHLQNNLGADADIAAFFVDRNVPADNQYWKGRLLYVSKGSGYLFIPLFFDLQYKCGVKKEDILDEGYVQIMEKILDSAAMHEFEQIDFNQHLDNCKVLIKDRLKNKDLYGRLSLYFSNEGLKPMGNIGTQSKALNRADTFLFLLCCLDIPENMTNKVLEEWYALVPSFLLMDDILDFKEDRQKNEENSINDFGEGIEGIEKAIDFLKMKLSRLKNTNLRLGEYFERSLEKKLQTPYMQSILNN